MITVYVLDFSVACEVCVDAILTAYVFHALAEALYIWNYYVSLVCVVILAVVILVVPSVGWFFLFLNSCISSCL